jgi:glycerol-3-phosphate dehydrogenase
MQRDLDGFRDSFDVAVIGGGIYGACSARLLAMQGLKVALIERGDFGGATSRNCAKLLHGGFRYVQHLDLPRIRESVRSQRDWLRAAPHLVRPLRFIIPTYGYGSRGPLALAGGMAAFHCFAWDRNQGVTPQVRLPGSGVMSRRRLIAAYPQLARADVTGGAWWYDAQILDVGRLTLECLADAGRHGATVANHVESIGLRQTAAGIGGVLARDRLSGREFEIDARVTVNAAGPWADQITGQSSPIRSLANVRWTRNINLVTRPLLAGCEAIGVASHRVSDARIGRSKRLFFISPWQDCSVIGTSHEAYQGNPDMLDVAEQEIAEFTAEINDALSDARLTREDLRSVHVGLTPAEDGQSERAKRSLLIDHAQEGLAGLISAVGIKYTTAPEIARKITQLVCRKLNVHNPPRRFAKPVEGTPSQPLEALPWAARIYGSRHETMLSAYSACGIQDGERLFRCRVLYGIRAEMVTTLGDALFRATDHAERGCLSAAQLQWCADTLAGEYQWSALRLQQELAATQASLQRMHSRPVASGYFPQSNPTRNRNISS